jgi:hypothetical protein
METKRRSRRCGEILQCRRDQRVDDVLTAPVVVDLQNVSGIGQLVPVGHLLVTVRLTRDADSVHAEEDPIPEADGSRRNHGSRAARNAARILKEREAIRQRIAMSVRAAMDAVDDIRDVRAAFSCRGVLDGNWKARSRLVDSRHAEGAQNRTVLSGSRVKR